MATVGFGWPGSHQSAYQICLRCGHSNLWHLKRMSLLIVKYYQHVCSSQAWCGDLKVYSNGLSEIMLGKAIKALNLPREELVIMTKVSIILVQIHTANWNVNIFTGLHGCSQRSWYEFNRERFETRRTWAGEPARLEPQGAFWDNILLGVLSLTQYHSISLPVSRRVWSAFKWTISISCNVRSLCLAVHFPISCVALPLQAIDLTTTRPSRKQ